jgi:hypothetical protein
LVTTCGPTRAGSSEPPIDRRHPGCTDPGPLRGRPGDVALVRMALASSVGALMRTLSLSILRWPHPASVDMGARHGVSGLNPVWGEAPRRLGGGEVPSTPRGVPRPLNPSCSASRSPQGEALLARAPSQGATPEEACEVMVSFAVVLRNRGDCRSRQETYLFCPRRG